MKESDCEDIEWQDFESAVKIIVESRSPFQLQNFFCQQLICDGEPKSFDEYLDAVDKFQELIPAAETPGTWVTRTLQMAFQGILDCSISVTNSAVYSSSVSSSSGYELQVSNYTGHGELSSGQIYRLRGIVERLKSTEYLGDCIGAYTKSRRTAVVARFRRFGIKDLQYLDDQEFAEKIALWIHTAKTFYSSIFPGERQYYDNIFAGVAEATYDNCFLAIVQLVASELNNLVNISPAVSFQSLFAILDLYKALLVILPEIKKMFHTVSCAYISDGASYTINSLETIVRRLFSRFKDAVLNESSNTLSPLGGIHYMTDYTMNFVTSILLYKDVLTNIIVTRPTESLGNEADEQFLEASGGTPLQLHMIWIMISLRKNLESKSTNYKDPSLGRVFIMNNLNYMTKIITGDPELLEMIGTEYQTKLSKDISQAALDYVSSIWHGVLYCSRLDGLSYKIPFVKGILRNSVKKRFKSFNTAFEEVCQTESTRIIPDTHLRAQLHELILSKLLPAYESFSEKFGKHIQSERYKERYIKYSSEDLQNKIQNLFLEYLIVPSGAQDIGFWEERFKTFNTALEKVCQTQSSRIIPDMHAQLHELILCKLLPAFESFSEKYGSHIQKERYKETYIKYSSEDLQNKSETLSCATSYKTVLKTKLDSRKHE
ncbi:hypothetical protein ACET3Z_004216 [Daucus carota]